MAWNTPQEILDYAIQREIQAHALYTRLAKQTTNQDMQETFNRFAANELQHRIRLVALKNREIDIPFEPVGHLDIAETVSEIQPGPDMDYMALLAFAMKKELKAYRLYTGMAMTANNPTLKTLFQQLAQEEAQHKLRLEIEYDLNTF
jgi:rubrerythrin